MLFLVFLYLVVVLLVVFMGCILVAFVCFLWLGCCLFGGWYLIAVLAVRVGCDCGYGWFRRCDVGGW